MSSHTCHDGVCLEGVTKTYGSGPSAVRALRGASVSFEAGSFTAIMGPSGSGKSTLVSIAAGLETPTEGRVALGGHDLYGLGETARTRLRRDLVGFVFQSFNLMPTLTVAQNVELPLRLAGRRAGRDRIAAALGDVGLSNLESRRPHELSGGQRQRVAIARALVAKPAVTFADEPTGALDLHAAAGVLGLLQQATAGAGHTVVMVTHDPVAAAHAERVVFLADGAIVDDVLAPTATEVAERFTDLVGVVT